MEVFYGGLNAMKKLVVDLPKDSNNTHDSHSHGTSLFQSATDPVMEAALIECCAELEDYKDVSTTALSQDPPSHNSHSSLRNLDPEKSNVLDNIDTILDDPDESFMTELRTEFSQAEQNKALYKHNYKYVDKICNTLQGELFRARVKSTEEEKKIYGQNIDKKVDIGKKYVMIKKTDKRLFEQKICIKDEMTYCIVEDVLKEACLLKYLTLEHSSNNRYIVAFIETFETDMDHYLVMEYIDGYVTLKDFIKQAFGYIKQKKLKYKEYTKMVKYIFWQIFASMHWLHVDMNC